MLEKQETVEYKLPDFKIDKLPDIKLKSIKIKNLKVFKDYQFDFYDKNGIKNFVCFIGVNGCGKSTLLSAIQLLFSNLSFTREESRKAFLEKSIRHVGKDANKDDDFEINATFINDEKEYNVIINKSGIVKDHPKEIRELAYRICYLARFDQELNKFQISRKKWPIFKELFEAVTGFEIEEDNDINDFFKNSTDSNMKSLIDDYVLSFYVNKPTGIIKVKECSDGEKKIIKAFSTILTLEYTPEIILIDNVEMHVERGRHLKLIEALKKCFPKSQIFTTTHSYHISRGFGERGYVYDLRIISANKFIKNEPWRLCIIDEITEAIVRIKAFKKSSKNEKIIRDGEKLLDLCNCKINNLQQLKKDVKKFLQECTSIFVNNVIQD